MAEWEGENVGGKWHKNKTLLNEFWVYDILFGSFLHQSWLYVPFCFLFASLLLLSFPMPFWTGFVCYYILILFWIFLFCLWDEVRWQGLAQFLCSGPASVSVFCVLMFLLLSLMFFLLQVMQILVLWSGTVLHHLLNRPESPTVGNWGDKSHGQMQMLGYLLQVYRTFIMWVAKQKQANLLTFRDQNDIDTKYLILHLCKDT